MRRICAEAEALCRVVAPDVATGPFYVVLRTDLISEYRADDGADGCTIAVISQTPPPAPFAELWVADVRARMSRYTTTDEISKALAACGHRILIPQA
jgi:hypothetical protein